MNPFIVMVVFLVRVIFAPMIQSEGFIINTERFNFVNCLN